MNKNIIIGAIVLGILVLGGVWWSQSKKGPSYAPLPIQSTDTTGMIIKDADAINVGDVDKEFQAIDKDLQTL